MRALITDGQDVRLERNWPEPDPKPGEAVIATRRVAISGLDRAAAGGLLDFRGVLGHAFVGTVQSVEPSGSGAIAPAAGAKIEPEQRVVGSICTSCSTCDLCQKGLRAHCRHQTILGLYQRDGCAAERFALPALNLVRVPESVDDERAVFAHDIAAAIQTARQITVEGKPYITVLGDGPLGLIMVQVLARLNASVRLIGHSATRLGICEKWGIKHRPADEIGRRADQDVVVDCTDSPGGLELAMQLVRPRGTIIRKCVLPPGAQRTVDLSPITRREITLTGSFDGPVSEAMRMIERGEIDVVSIIGRRMKLDDGPMLLRATTQPDALRILAEV